MLYKDGFVVAVVVWVSQILWIDSTMLMSVEPEEQPPSNYETALRREATPYGWRSEKTEGAWETNEGPGSHCLSPGLLTSGLVTKKSKTLFG